LTSFADDEDEKNAFWSTFTFCSFVVALLLSVSMKTEIEMLLMYFLIYYIVLSFALFTNSFHMIFLARFISMIYLFAFTLHAALFISCLIHQYTFFN